MDSISDPSASISVPGLTPFRDYDIRVIKSNCEQSLREYIHLQNIASGYEADDVKVNADSKPKNEEFIKERLRAQATIALHDLSSLRHEVKIFRKSLARSRTRHWLIGGSILSGVTIFSILPTASRFSGGWNAGYGGNSDLSLQNSTAQNSALTNTSSPGFGFIDTAAAYIKDLAPINSGFRRGKHENSTQLESTIQNSTLTNKTFMGQGKAYVNSISSSETRTLANVVLYCAAFVYIAQNELSIRVARAVTKALNRLFAKIEEGKELLTREDLEILTGWRWRVLFWE